MANSDVGNVLERLDLRLSDNAFTGSINLENKYHDDRPIMLTVRRSKWSDEGYTFQLESGGLTIETNLVTGDLDALFELLNRMRYWEAAPEEEAKETETETA